MPLGDEEEKQMRQEKFPPKNLGEWVEFCWLLATNTAFRAAPDRRKAYFEHRLAKIYSVPCY